MKISYAITVCNELEEIKRLLPFLKENKRIDDEIVILFDGRKGTQEVLDYLLKFNKCPNVQTWRSNFDGHFGNWKNKLTSYCKGDIIFQIDADEQITKAMMDLIPTLIEENPEVDVFLVPRINLVQGLTEEHIKKWGWQVNPRGWVNFPDYQRRIYKNNPNIKWINKVHETLIGYQKWAVIPSNDDWCLLHSKNIKKQEEQNNYYDTL
jgi:hypothetical protein